MVQFNGLVDSWGSFIGKYYGDGYNQDEGAVIHTHWDSLQSITFSMQNGSNFDLNYIDVTTNTVYDSWLTASNGATIQTPHSELGFIDGMARLWLTSDFDNITSFTITSNDAYCFGMDNFYINEPPPVNPDDQDTDGDGITDSNDNCLMAPNADQKDADADGMGDVCDTCPHDPDNDIDADGICGDDGGCTAIDNCPNIANPDQSDEDSDGLDDACDDDDDNDGILNASDNCQFDANPDQADLDKDEFGDVCDTDSDGDKVIDATDQCLGTSSGAVVNAAGCAIEQLCPCATTWKNHGGYVKCVAHAAKDFLAAGLIIVEQREEYLSTAARSECGHKKPKRNLHGKHQAKMNGKHNGWNKNSKGGHANKNSHGSGKKK